MWSSSLWETPTSQQEAFCVCRTPGSEKGLFCWTQLTPILAIPGADHSFGQLQLALALGDFESLGRRQTPVIRLHLSSGAEQGLIQLEAINHALGTSLIVPP
jgi:hypothetical protein